MLYLPPLVLYLPPLKKWVSQHNTMSRFMVDILARYGLTATQIGQNSHAWVQVNGYYSDPTFYATSGGNSSYIMSNTVWNDGQH